MGVGRGGVPKTPFIHFERSQFRLSSTPECSDVHMKLLLVFWGAGPFVALLLICASLCVPAWPSGKTLGW